jgi:hypothetical protein
MRSFKLMASVVVIALAFIGLGQALAVTWCSWSLNPDYTLDYVYCDGFYSSDCQDDCDGDYNVCLLECPPPGGSEYTECMKSCNRVQLECIRACVPQV